MPAKKDHECEVLLNDDLKAQFANAIRIEDNPDDPTECFLDFLLYAPAIDRAVVVSRIQIKRGFIAHLRDHLDNSLNEILFQA